LRQRKIQRDAKLFIEAGLDEETAWRLAADIQTDEPYDGMHPLEMAMEDTGTGRLHLPADALAYYRRRFAQAGLSLDPHLGNRQALCKAWKTVLRHERQTLAAADAARMESFAPHDAERGFLCAMYAKDGKAASHYFETMKRRTKIQVVNETTNRER